MPNKRYEFTQDFGKEKDQFQLACSGMIPEELDLSRNLWIALARWKEREQELNY